MTEEQWRKEAKRYSFHRYCYADLIDDFEVSTKQAFSQGENPYDYVDYLGDKYDLDRCDINWGIHQNQTFEKVTA
jgi:hypothetical protein